MLGNQKNVFWEALLIAGVVFILGLLLGVFVESNRLNDINEYYAQSEISLMDMLALSKMTDMGNISCNKLIESNIKFADRIYEEARLLEKFEESGRISENFKLAHRKYDILRTILWTNLIKIDEECNKEFSTVVYLYEFDSEDLDKKAKQEVWSRILFNLKQESGKKIILVPIAVNSDLESLDSLISEFEISEFPVVIIDNEHIVRNLTSVEDLKKYL